MTAMTILKSNEVEEGHLPSAGQRPGADSGDPQLGVLRIAPNAMGNVGIWECQPGGWPVRNRADTEVGYILAGVATLTDASTGITTKITAGDLFVLPKGWTGRWDVIETIRKVYTIY
ncbi:MULTISPECIES: cupin domain-containing protein [Rhizobium/Agrobacterium group]|uniref:DUF861 domain-containing protein n=1 Tax=Rhizobium rhizogenes TaxID=359 RepID=A0A546X3E7_RHIRH|nr:MULTISPECIES: cupin domain-containing protein [Rhizobium/Agrobacterium group]TRA95283.1 DUF861 domain-containing protein [Rhizobium rhizogenes]